MLSGISRLGNKFPVLAVLFSVFLTSTALAVHDDGNIELDGNVVSDGGVDWEDVYTDCGSTGPCPPATTGASRQSFQTDSGLPDATSFTGSKDADAVNSTAGGASWQCTEGQVQGKSDIEFAYGAVYDALGEKTLYAGMDRRSFNGTSYMGIWLFQQEVGCVSAGGATPFTGHKTDGDLLLIINYTNGGAVNSVNVYRWTDPDFVVENGDECLGGARGPVGDECVNEDLLYFSSVDCANPVISDPPINDSLCGITNAAVPISPSWRTDAPLGDNAFFEAGINLTAFSLTDSVSGSECYSSVMIETRSSAELTADLKDFVFLDLATCGTVTVEKVTNVATADQFDYTIDQPAGALGTTAFSLAGGESITLDAVESGTYVFTEGLLPNEDWSLESISCTEGQGATDLVAQTVEVTISTENDVVCTFTNSLELPVGTLLVSKSCDSVDDGGQTFDFTITGPEGALAASTTAECQDGAVTLACGESVSCQGLLIGAYTVDESAPADWDVTNVTCNGGAGSTCGAAESPLASVTIGEGEGEGSVTVQVENTEVAAIEITKITVPAGIGGQFDFTGDLGAFDLAHGETDSFPDLTPNQTYSVTETAKAGFTITDFTCSGSNWAVSGGGATVDITPAAGETVSCTVTNTQNPGTITVCKATDPAGALTSFAFELDGPSAGLPTSANLVDGECSEPVVVAVGTGYSITETPMAGWVLTSATCSDSSPVNSIDVSADEAVICTFTNTRVIPDISITKSPNSQSLLAGETANFTIEVTNTGEIDLENVVVTDTLVPDCDADIGDLAIGESTDYDCALSNVQVAFTNVADVIGDPVDGSDPVEDSDTARVNIYTPPINVPVDGKWALLLLILSIIGIAWYRRPARD